MSAARTPLEIIVVGGGVVGMTVATFLKQDGHTVTVLERQARNSQLRSAGGIGLTYNSKRLWQQRGLWDRISTVVEPGHLTRAFSYKGNAIATIPSSMGHAHVHRADLINVLSEIAIEHKVDIHFEAEIKSVIDNANRPSVVLQNGERLEADLIIGADGINSFVRRQFYPEIKPQLGHSVILLVNVSPEVMQQTESTRDLWNDSPLHHTVGAAREIVSWPLKKHDPPCYHLNFCDHGYIHGDSDTYGQDSPGSPLVLRMEQMSGFRDRWNDFHDGIKHILNSTKDFTRWKIAEVPEMESYISPQGGFVLIGDAAHAVQPFAGQGANMSIEDSACLAILLGSIESKQQISIALKLYDELRLPRLARLRRIIQTNIATFGTTNKADQERRDKALREFSAAKRSATPAKDSQIPDVIAGMKWLVGYDMISETEKAWRDWKDYMQHGEQARL